VKPRTRCAIERDWRVRRQDDNGVVFDVACDLSRTAAERLVARFTARGHKQLYWIERHHASR